MQRVLSVGVILSLALASSSWGDPGEESEKQVAKDPLPQTRQIKWDARLFEESPVFTMVRRQVKGNRVTWVLENRLPLGNEIQLGYNAMLYDEDGVKLATIGIETDPFLLHMFKGERNRYILHLPPADKLKGVRKLVIKNGPY